MKPKHVTPDPYYNSEDNSEESASRREAREEWLENKAEIEREDLGEPYHPRDRYEKI